MKLVHAFLLLTTCLLYGQEKEITVFDIETNEPIDQVQLFYKDLGIGSVTNENGKAIINLQDSKLSILHIGYNQRFFEKNEIVKKDTIKLSKKVNSLDEVVLTNINLRKKLQYVLDNYDDLYVNNPTEKHCSFKESFKLDNEYKRLFLAQIRWWSASSSIKYKKKYGKTLKLKLDEIKYNKSEPLNFSKTVDNKENNSGAITTKSLIIFFYLNHAINSILNKGPNDLDWTVSNTNKHTTTVSFNTEWVIDDKKVAIRNTGEVTFDNASNAIINFEKKVEYKNRIVEETGKQTGIKTKTEYKDNAFKYRFIKNKDDKWSLKLFSTSIVIDYTYDSKKHTMFFSNSLYVLNELKTKKMSNKGLMDLNLPIYKNLTSETIINTNSILLTEKEKAFINKNE